MDAPLLPGLAGALVVEPVHHGGLVLGPGRLPRGDGHLVHHPPLLLLQEGGPPVLLDEDDHLVVLHHGLVHPGKDRVGDEMRRQEEEKKEEKMERGCWQFLKVGK